MRQMHRTCVTLISDSIENVEHVAQGFELFQEISGINERGKRRAEMVIWPSPIYVRPAVPAVIPEPLKNPAMDASLSEECSRHSDPCTL